VKYKGKKKTKNKNKSGKLLKVKISDDRVPQATLDGHKRKGKKNSWDIAGKTATVKEEVGKVHNISNPIKGVDYKSRCSQYKKKKKKPGSYLDGARDNMYKSQNVYRKRKQTGGKKRVKGNVVQFLI